MDCLVDADIVCSNSKGLNCRNLSLLLCILLLLLLETFGTMASEQGYT